MNDFSINRNIQGMKSIGVVVSVLVYLLVVVYAEYHFFNLVTQFVPGELQVVGLIAVAASGLTAVALPLAIHYWFRSGYQLIGGWIFYAIHFLAVFANLILDSSLTASGQAPAFVAEVYAVYILPGYIAFYALAWSIIWFVDSGSQRIDKRREAQELEEDAALKRRNLVANAKNQAIETAFQSEGAQRTINIWAARNAPRMLARELDLTDDELGAAGDFTFWVTPAASANSAGNSANGTNGNGARKDTPLSGATSVQGG